ncbi:Ankyrin repeat-containing protein [Glarea lozoyensis ATCC 20868]|uniref:Ankyrin repeat-containing protein n=1 Tax=Glarea lozoyensis (strain ATCC 20868 / MF5171) TaxID=1116229 RepID=S3DCP3_GLAL2|nr:Ankyrin repeat-containing protein [Glarea lozoyensis ATCC 20868]EPE34834.1 Ankyrin repeat-containing protein [Glarea lozoyensis ATCC 20868]
MNHNIQLPADAIERRRLQNRVAQRKFRQKRLYKSIDPASIENPSSIVSIPAPEHQRVITTTTDTSNAITSDFFSSTETFDSLVNPPHQHHDSPRLEAGHFEEWDVAAMDSILASNNISFSTDDGSNFHLNMTPQDISPFTPIASTFLGPHSSNDVASRPPPISPQPVELDHNLLGSAHDKGWLSTIHIAARTGNDLILKILIQQDTDLNEKDSNGRTPLIYAVIEDHQTIVTALLAHGARINEMDCDDRSALHWAVLHCREDILKTLLEHKEEQELDVDAPDFSGWTPMHMAVHANFEAGVKMLLDCGANINIKARYCPYAEKLIPGLLTRKPT